MSEIKCTTIEKNWYNKTKRQRVEQRTPVGKLE